MGALGVLAAVAVFIGGVHTTMVMSENDRQTTGNQQEPVVEVQAVRTDTVRPGAAKPADRSGF